MIPAHLTSPGSAIAARAELEYRYVRVLTRMLDEFLGETRSNLYAAILDDGHVLLAAPAPREPFAWTTVLRNWAQVVDDLANHADLMDDDLVRQLLRDSEVPSKVHSAISSIVIEGREAGMSAAQIKREVRELVAPPKPGHARAGNEAYDSWRNAVLRIARQAATDRYNTGALAELMRYGYTHKMWVSRRDQKVRESHVHADGQVRPVLATFEVGGFALAYPSDPTGPPHETLGCRCVVVAKVTAA